VGQVQKHLERPSRGFEPPDASVVKNARKKLEGNPVPLLDLYVKMKSALQYAFCEAKAQVRLVLFGFKMS